MKHIFKVLLTAVNLLIHMSINAEPMSPFFLTSDPIFKANDPKSLKGIDSFVFLFTLQLDKAETVEILDLFSQELSKVGQVVKKEIFTDHGIDIQCFSNHRLTFSLAQLVDTKGLPLPVLKAQLAENGMVEICKNKVVVPLDTNVWSLYLTSEKQNVRSALKASLPVLLQAFLADFVKVNGKDKRPNFLITYDTSWWNTASKD